MNQFTGGNTVEASEGGTTNEPTDPTYSQNYNHNNEPHN